MKRFAATAITLMMSAAIGTAAASSFDDHNDNRQTQTASHSYNRGGERNANVGNVRYDNRNANGANIRYGNRNFSGNNNGRRWNGERDGRWNGGYRYSGGRYYNRGYYGYDGYRGYYPGVVIVDGAAPYYYDAPYAYDNGSYAYDNGPVAYGNGYAACDSRERYDNNGGALVGAVVGGVLGHTVGKGDGRTAATVAGAAIGYGVGASVDNDRRYDDCGRY